MDQLVEFRPEVGEVVVGGAAVAGRLEADGCVALPGVRVRPLSLRERERLVAATAGVGRAARLARLVGDAAVTPRADGGDEPVPRALVEAVALHLAGAAGGGSLARATVLARRWLGAEDPGSLDAREADRVARELAEALAARAGDAGDGGWTVIHYEAPAPAGPAGIVAARDRLAAMLAARADLPLERPVAEAIMAGAARPGATAGPDRPPGDDDLAPLPPALDRWGAPPAAAPDTAPGRPAAPSIPAAGAGAERGPTHGPAPDGWPWTTGASIAGDGMPAPVRPAALWSPPAHAPAPAPAASAAAAGALWDDAPPAPAHPGGPGRHAPSGPPPGAATEWRATPVRPAASSWPRPPAAAPRPAPVAGGRRPAPARPWLGESSPPAPGVAAPPTGPGGLRTAARAGDAHDALAAALQRAADLRGMRT